MKTPIEYIDLNIEKFEERLNSWISAPEDKKSYEYIITLKGIILGLKIAKETF